MTPEEKRIAFAELTGWTDLWWAPEGDLRAAPELLGRQRPDQFYTHVPDPANNRDVIVEAWKGLSEREQHLAAWHLCSLTTGEPPLQPKRLLNAVFLCLTAEPHQLLDAWLYAKGLMKTESKV